MAKKKTVIIISVLSGILAFFAAMVLFVFFESQKIKKEDKGVPEEDKMKKILESLTAPGAGEPVPKEVLDSLTAPKKKPSPVPEDVLKSLTAPAK